MKIVKSIFPMVSRDVLMPKFASRFVCKGPECPLSCCCYFIVTFEKKAYEQLEHGLDLTPEQKKKYKKVGKAQRSESNYAQFISSSDDRQACGFLENNLCSLHRDYGEEALPTVCYFYPRLYRSFGREHTELVLSISCPLVANDALLNPDALDFVVQHMTWRKDADDPQMPLFNDHQIKLDIRFFCLQLMRVQEIDLWKRLAFLGLFTVQLEDIVVQHKSSSTLAAAKPAIDNLIASATALIEEGAINDIYANVVEDCDYLVHCYQFFLQVQRDWEKHSAFNHVFAEFNEIFFADGGDFFYEDLLRTYQQGYQNLQSSLKNAPFFFEHLILSHMLFLLYPFHKLDITQCYHHLCFVFVFCRWTLSVYCAAGERHPEEITLLLAKLMRILQHTAILPLTQVMNVDALGWEDLSMVYANLKDPI